MFDSISSFEIDFISGIPQCHSACTFLPLPSRDAINWEQMTDLFLSPVNSQQAWCIMHESVWPLPSLQSLLYTSTASTPLMEPLLSSVLGYFHGQQFFLTAPWTVTEDCLTLNSRTQIKCQIKLSFKINPTLWWISREQMMPVGVVERIFSKNIWG